ncbi:MAG TPA: TRAP transporter substrate-binding protein [Beijerinckiaceae bacterium]|nr:TRAP transporter substrate-binding protein [Rhodoblastus sp.]MCB9997901.1 TRAP transporter substrate-binding protein [Methylobacteriaceae bacterium]MCC2109643.1 TRAP transporter substrate-binding protein [Hyphomicrobiales bacterium]HRY04612.1 TRAP transporter substrate-binding protein [Beijerinckiaceae bacterium]MCC0001969.1 TRAP transporter substrate-binding protein [Methylobacteriaceae bacterium]
MKKFLMAASCLAALAAAPAAVAQDKQVNLKISFWVPAQHPLVPATKKWAEDIEKESGGTIKATLFPSEQLGKAFDHYDMARDGIADVTYVNPGYQPGRFAIVSLGQVPFIFGDGHKGTQAFDAWYRKYAAKEMKDTHYCFGFIHDPGAIHSRTKKVMVPGDISGMKIRPAQSTIGQMVKSLGGTNVQASAPESRDALERGVADAITFPWGSVFLFGIDKVTKYHMDVPLYSTVFTYSMNKAVYDGMSAAQKKVIDNHCTTEWAEKVAGPWADFEAAGREKMRKAEGHEVYKISADQLAQWKKVVEPLEKDWAEAVKKAGGDPVAIKADLDATVKKYGAGL